MVLADPLGADGRALPAPPLGGRGAPGLPRRDAGCRRGGGAGSGRDAGPGTANTRLGHPGYLLERSAPALGVVRAVASPHLRVLYDVYHTAVMGEDVPGTLEAALDWIGEVHLADVPGRYEPGTGPLDWAAIDDALPRGQ